MRVAGGMTILAGTLALATLLGLGAAAAQMVLPGAVAPSSEGDGAPAPAGRPKPKPKPQDGAERMAKGTTVAVPSIIALDGRTLVQNGTGSQVVFAPADKTVAVGRLTLEGEKVSNALETCRVENSGGTPLTMSGLGKPNGLERYRIEFPACPIAFDVLDGAILVDAAQPACDFVAADCRIKPAGLWGPAPADFGPDRVKSLERARGAAEGAVRSNYKALAASTKDRPTIMGFARDQAQFSSSREEICRDYAEEGRHGFCATKLTEARAALLHDRLGTALVDKATRKAAKHHGGKSPAG